MRRLKILAYLIVLHQYSFAQNLSQDHLQYLNQQIRFLNESVHRMVIVFQVYENYNSEVTKHVDLPSNEGIKNTSTHLPGNLFADNSLVRSGDSPIEIYEQLKADTRKANFPINNTALIDEARRIIDFLNKDRKDLDRIIEEENLEEFASIQAIYEELEQAVIYYDKIRSNIKMFEKLIINYHYNIELPAEEKQVYTALLELHFDIKKIVRQLRNENRSGVVNGISKLNKEISWAKKCVAEIVSPTQRIELESVITSIEKLIAEIQKYIDGVPTPNSYNAFGRGYFYHNYELLPKINQYGSGYVWKLEEFFKKHNWAVINFLEEPHFIKIVYAERMPLEILKDKDISPTQNIREIKKRTLPNLESIVVEKPRKDPDIPSLNENQQNSNDEMAEEKVNDMKYTITHSENIRVDTSHFNVYLRDHLRKDGDRVSINVNGEWIYNRISLEQISRKLELVVNNQTPNFIIIRADNEGWLPPNTISVKYKSKDGSADVFIKKDLALYEAIELKFSN